MNEIAENIEEFEKPKSESQISPPEESASTFSGSIAAAVGEINERIGKRRWIICALLFFATTINYIDRQVLGLITTDETFRAVVGWDPIKYGWINTAFQGAYAAGLLVVGALMDRFGTRRGFSITMVVWSVAAMAHSAARSALGFGVARIALGLGEAGNFPAAIKTVAEWFPRKERALATGIFNSGSNIGAIIAPLTVPFIAVNYGWQWAFIMTGAIGFIWLIFWLAIYQKPDQDKKLSRAEFAHIQSDSEEPVKRIPWARLLVYRQTWSFAIGKFLTDPVWWVWLFWLPPFLNAKFGLDITQIGPPLIVIYIVADIGSIGGGWLSSTFIKRGWSVNFGRKISMLICAVCVVPVVFATLTPNLWTSVLLISLAAAAHQGWSANIFTTASDMFPRQAVGSVVGFGGMTGSIGGMILQASVGFIVAYTNSYFSVFIIAASAYLVALLLMQLLTPRLEPIVLAND
jgi:ACS family hexuronate transporter-like MFS transporter